MRTPNASAAVAADENETVATTRKAAATPRASHERKRDIDAPLVLGEGIARSRTTSGGHKTTARASEPHAAACGSSRTCRQRSPLRPPCASSSAPEPVASHGTYRTA